MTTVALTAAPSTDLRPVPWRQLAWVTWRRYRLSLIVWRACWPCSR